MDAVRSVSRLRVSCWLAETDAHRLLFVSIAHTRAGATRLSSNVILTKIK